MTNHVWSQNFTPMYISSRPVRFLEHWRHTNVICVFAFSCLSWVTLSTGSQRWSRLTIITQNYHASWLAGGMAVGCWRQMPVQELCIDQVFCCQEEHIWNVLSKWLTAWSALLQPTFKKSVYLLGKLSYNHLLSMASVSHALQQTDLASKHSLWPALSFGTSCLLLHEPPAPASRTVSNEHWICFCLNEWASCYRWQNVWRTVVDGAIAKTVALTLMFRQDK